MLEAGAPSSGALVPAPLPLGRWIGVGSLLLLEYLAASVIFDVQPLRTQIAWLGWTGHAAMLSAIALTAVLALGRAPDVQQLTQLRARIFPLPRLWRVALAHALAIGGVFALSHVVLGVGLSTAAHPRVLLLAWVLLVLLALGTAFAMAVPLRAVPLIARLTARPVGVGAVAGFLAWVAARATEGLWPYVSGATLRLAVALLTPFAGGDLYVDLEKHYLGLGDFVVEVSAECSGLQGTGLIAALSIAYLARFRKEVWLLRAWAIVPLGIVGAYLANVVRIAALVLVGRWFSPEVALGGFHSKAGWLLTCALALGLLAWVRRSRSFNRDLADVQEGEQEEEQDGRNPAVPYLVPLLLNLALILVTGAGSASSFDRFFPIRALVVTASLLWLLPWRQSPRKYWRFSVTSFFLPALIGALVLPLWLLTIRATPPDGEPVRAGLATLSATGRIAWLSVRVCGAVIVAPIVEELAFRGFLLRRLYGPDFDRVDYAAAARSPWPLFATSVAFGALHRSFAGGTLAGIAYGLALIPRGRLADAVTAHVVTNVLLMAYVLITSDWTLLA